MRQIFVNLKRFEVPRSAGGLCPEPNPIQWIEKVISASVELGLGANPGVRLVYLLPEGLVAAARHHLQMYPSALTRQLDIGCQGVHWQNIQPGGNFGAFTTSLPAAAAAALGAQWAIIGHSEERRARLQVIAAYDLQVDTDPAAAAQASQAVNQLIQAEVRCALDSGLNVLLCVGETAAERGEGEFSEQQPRIEAVLQSQLLVNLKTAQDALQAGQLVIGYEPIWAIGPGKIPPDGPYIQFVSNTIKQVVRSQFNAECAVVYGGGLKEANAAMIAAIPSIDGGLVALTRFSGEIGFYVEELKQIVARYLEV